MSIEDFIDFHTNFFIPAYSDLVAYIADKPQQIIFEIENTFSHLMVYHSNPDQSIKDSNLNKAYNHLLRATMDYYKMLWSEMSTNLDSIFKENNSFLFFNDNQNNVMSLWISFKRKAKEARNEELKNVGVNFMEAICLYKEAVDIGSQILDKYDSSKHDLTKDFNFKILIKQQWLGFVFGIFAGVLGNYLFKFLGN